MISMQVSVAAHWRRYRMSPDDAAWSRLVEALQGLLYPVVVRVSLRWGVSEPDAMRDVVQEVLLKLNRDRGELPGKIPDDAPGGIEAYFRAIAANAAHDYWKQRRAAVRDEGKTEQLGPSLENTFGVAATVERKVLINQIDRLLEPDPKTRTIFWLYYRQGLTAKEIASIPAFNLTVKGVESALHRQAKAVREKMNQGGRETVR